DDMPVRELQVEVAPPVLLEGVGVVVYPATVGLDDEPRGRPVEVHAVVFAMAVDDRHREVRARDQLQEAALQLGAGERQLGKEAGEEALELGACRYDPSRGAALPASGFGRSAC